MHIDDLLQQDGPSYLASSVKSPRKILCKEPSHDHSSQFAEAFLVDLPEADLGWLDAGQFVLDENAAGSPAASATA